jgi:hypothetical protein
LKKVGEQVKESFESGKVVIEVKSKTFGSQDQTGSQLTHINFYKIPLEERQKGMGPIIDWSTVGKRFPGLDTSSIWQLDLEKFCKTQEGADMKPAQFSSDPAVIFILNRFDLESKHCMDARSLFNNMFKSGVWLTKDQVRWLGYPYKGVGRS